MARVKRLSPMQGNLPFNGEAILVRIGQEKHREITSLAADKYDEMLASLSPKKMRQIGAKHPNVVFAVKRPFELEVLVVEIKGKEVSFWMTPSLFSETAGAISAFLNDIIACLPKGSDLRVVGNEIVGNVTLSREAEVLPFPGGNTREKWAGKTQPPNEEEIETEMSLRQAGAR